MRNRNWVVGSSTNLREALAYIIQKNPQYVLITADHPNKKVRMLPKMLVQAFPVRIIGFAEKGSGNSTKFLQEMNLEYNLYPPVSGPAIERMVLKIKKDEEQRAQEAAVARTRAENGETAGDDLITFKGDAASPDAARASFEQARAALSQLISTGGEGSDDPAIVGGEGGANPHGAAYMPNASNADPNSNPNSGPAYTGSALGSGSSAAGEGAVRTGFGSSSAGPGSGQGSGNASGMGTPSSSGRPTPTDPRQGGIGHGKSGGTSGAFDPNNPSSQGGSRGGFDSGPGFSGFNNAGGGRGPNTTNPNNPSSGALGSGSPLPNGARGGIGHGDSQPVGTNSGDSPQNSSSDSSTGESGSGGRGSRQKSTPIMESEYVPKSQRAPYRMRQEKEPKPKSETQSLFIRGSEKALKDSTNLVGEDKAEEIQKSSNMACISVESPRFSGYLVCAMGRDRKIDPAFMDTIQRRLFQFLKENGEDVKDQKSMQLKLQEVDFTAWTLEQAEFLKKSVHDGDEIAIAFFPTKIKDDELKASVSKKMLMIQLNDLESDAVVEFDLYIFMPENNKYLLYTPQGRPFDGKQKDRLKTKGVTHMHLKNEAAPSLKKYRAQNFLNDKIASYKNAQKKPA